MGGLENARITVVGAGVAGLCVALELRARGAEVTLVDEGGPGPNTSAVAAGMIAPAFEAALEEPGAGRLALLRAGRDLWPEAADGTVTLYREGALWAARPGEEVELERVEAGLKREGAVCERLSADAAQALSPELTDTMAGAVYSPEDWRVDASAALEAMATAFQRRGGRRRRETLNDLATEVRSADAVVLCAGWPSRRFADIAPELARLRPIAGELVRFPGQGPASGPVIRTTGGYLVPGESGLIAGASMIEGLEEAGPTREARDRFVALARSVFPRLAGASWEAAAGVRAATPDGLPLVGPSVGGAHLATGFRRNGWVLAPLAARITADQLAGRDPGPWADALRPDRFA